MTCNGSFIEGKSWGLCEAETVDENSVQNELIHELNGRHNLPNYNVALFEGLLTTAAG